MTIFRPKRFAIGITNIKPAILTKYTIDPIHDASSTVTGPLDNGVSSDRKIGNAGESHPKPHPAQTVAIFAIYKHFYNYKYYFQMV